MYVQMPRNSVAWNSSLQVRGASSCHGTYKKKDGPQSRRLFDPCQRATGEI